MLSFPEDEKLGLGSGPVSATFPGMKPAAAAAAAALAGLLFVTIAPPASAVDRAHSEIESEFAEFVEPDFPFFTQIAFRRGRQRRSWL